MRIIKISELTRSFSTTLSEFGDYRFSLFSIPARLVTVTPFIFIFLIINRKRKMDKCIFTISFLLSILFYLFNAGRAPLLSFLLCFVYMCFRKMFKKAWVKIIFMGILFLPLLEVLDNIFFYLSYNQWIELKIDYLKYVYEFSMPHILAMNAHEITKIYGLRFGCDFITAFLNLIPGINFQISYEIPSLFLVGDNWKFLGGVPSDFLTFSYMQFSIIGVIFISSIMGCVYRKIDKSISLLSDNSSKDLITAIVTVYSFSLIGSADFEAVLRGGVILTIILLILLRILKYRKYFAWGNEC